MFKETLINETCKLFKVHQRDLLGDYRFKFLMPARFALAKALRMRGWSYPQIAKAIGSHHTTALYRVREAEYRMTRDPKFAKKVHHLAKFGKEIENAP